MGYYYRVLMIFLFSSALVPTGSAEPKSDLLSLQQIDPGSKPNIILLVTDDLSLSVMRALLEQTNDPETANLRRMYSESMIFENAYITTPLCCPSRVTFLTGKYAHNHGVKTNSGGDLGGIKQFRNKGHVGANIGTALTSAGYHTGYIGKYLNGYNEQWINTYYADGSTPPGWSEWHGLIDATTYSVYKYRFNDNGAFPENGQSPYTCSKSNFANLNNFDPKQPEIVAYRDDPDCRNNYQAHQISLRTEQFLTEALANNEQPYFLFINPLAPHIENELEEGATESWAPTVFKDWNQNFLNISALGFHHMIRPAPQYIGRYEFLNVESYRPATTFNEPDDDDKPAWIRKIPPLNGNQIDLVDNQFRRAMEAMLSVDDILGKIFDFLDNTEQNDTLLIFTSDHGYFYGEHKLNSKGLPYEESIGVPLLVRLPSMESRTVEEIVLNTDYAPTLLELAGLPELMDGLDGRSLLSLFNSAPVVNWRKQFLVELLSLIDGDELLVDSRFMGIRTGNNLSSPLLANKLYAEYYHKDQNNLDQIKAWEMYDLGYDEHQGVNLLLPHPDVFTIDNPVHQILKDRLDRLSNCGGPASDLNNCFDAENIN